MSEISKHREDRLKAYKEVFMAIMKKDKAIEKIEKNRALFNSIQPIDVIYLIDELMRELLLLTDIKDGINRFLKLTSKDLKINTIFKSEPNSLLEIFKQNNQVMETIIKGLKPLIIALNKDPRNQQVKRELLSNYKKLEQFTQLYTIKENILFPVLEGKWKNYRCLQIMWSFDDDAKRDVKDIIQHLSSPEVELVHFNRLCGAIHSNMLGLKFKEEHILFPYITQTIDNNEINALIPQCQEFGFPFIQADIASKKPQTESSEKNNSNHDLGTGNLSLEQIKLIFNHLPVDITYVDENDKVCYFSTPPKRIFPRTKAIIGRDVKNCHPPESVHVVEQIVRAFKSGEKDMANFWIKMQGEYIYIQYFAVRNENGEYKGVIEVTQEVSEINQLTGERRLLDWE